MSTVQARLATSQYHAPRYSRGRSGRALMAAPPNQPNWWDILLGGGLFAVLIPKIVDWFRNGVATRRREYTVVKVAEIEDDAAFRKDLLTRVKDLEGMVADRDREHRAEIVSLRTEMQMERASAAAFRSRERLEMLNRMDKIEMALNGEPSDLTRAVREVLYEFRSYLHRDDLDGPIGDIETGKKPQ